MKINSFKPVMSLRILSNLVIYLIGQIYLFSDLLLFVMLFWREDTISVFSFGFLVALKQHVYVSNAIKYSVADSSV